MKTIAIWAGISAACFVAMGFQMGVFRQAQPKADESSTEAVERPAPPKVIAKFPDDLVPASRAQPVPAAAEYKPTTDAHPMVFMRVNGVVHPWQEAVRDDWQAETVATTELVIVIGTPKKIYVDRYTYPNNAPPITRYIFELEISVIEAKTGKILANRLFRNVPRPIMPVEAWETTAIGRAVSMQQVFGWVTRMSRSGFPEGHDPTPITTQAD